MKKSLSTALSTALLAATPIVSHAQSTVTLYGIVDEGITYTNNQSGHADYQLQSSVASASRWGLRGAEDLGGGTKAIFVLENGFDPSTGNLGNNGRIFGRQAFVGLSSRYGTVTMGRQYDEVVDMLAPIDASLKWGIYFAHAGDVDNTSGSVRINNSVKYISPNISGITVGALYSFGGQPGQFSSQSTSSAGISYTQGPLYLAAAYMFMKNPFAAGFDSLAPKNIIYSAYVPSAQSWRVAGAGGSYAIGPVSAGFEYTSTQFAKGFAGNNVNFDNYEANVGWLVRPDIQFGVAYVYTHGKIDATSAAPIYRAIDLSADYFLSKRTDIYLAGVVLKAGGSATQAQITTLSAASSTTSQVSLRVGIRHKF